MAKMHIALLTGLLSHIGMKDADKQNIPAHVTRVSPSSPVLVYSKNRRNG
ncbi:hypothetical protein ACLB1O_10270 [Escherichia coli]